MSAYTFQSSGLKAKVDQLMNILFAGGVNNPMASIEQISYLLFLRLLTEKDEVLARLDRKHRRIFSGNWARFAWGNFVTLTGDQLFEGVRTAIESIHELPGLSATGKLLFQRATLKVYDRPTLRAVVQGINEMDLATHERVDIKGDMYEYLLSRLAVSGTNGQFRTPRHIIDMIVSLVDPGPSMRICDPACGTAGFLVSAYNHILRKKTSKASLARGHVDGDLLTTPEWKFMEEQAFTGYDNDAEMVKIAIMNLYLHRLEKAGIEFHNPLTSGKGGTYPGLTFDAILANPPFAGKVQAESILSDLNHGLNTRATELLFVKWFIDHLAPGGRAGVIVPNGVLFGSTKAARKVRELLLTECELQAVVSMPSGVFRPYAGVSTAALVFRKRPTPVGLAATTPSPRVRGEGRGEGATDPSVWFYDLTADGFSLDDKRTPTAANDIPDLLAKWPKREEGANSFRVPVARIMESDLSLAVGRYRETKAETKEHDPPVRILKGVMRLEDEIRGRADRLLKQIR